MDDNLFHQLFSSVSDNSESKSKMAFKLFVLITVASCYVFSSTNAAEADWEVLNFAINDPGNSNPEIVKNSVLNILQGFVPQGPLFVPAPTASTAAPTAAPTAPPATAPPATAAPRPQPPYPYPPYPIYIPQPQPQPGQQQQLPFPFPFPFPFPQPQPQPTVAPTAAPTAAPQPTAGPCPACWSPSPCGCSNQKKNLAEFLVDVPCPTTTPKPIKQIVVKVPCPTTTQKPCECQCCPCNPCKPAKKKQAKEVKVSSEEESHEETKTIYKSYDPVIKKYVDAKRNIDSPKTRQVSPYQPRGDYQQINMRRDFDEYLN